MKTKIIKTFNGLPVVGTWAICQYVQLEHRLVKNLVEKYSKQISALSTLPLDIKKPLHFYRNHEKAGAPIFEYLLEANQMKFVLMMLPCKGKMLKSKLFLVTSIQTSDAEFFHQLEEVWN